MAEGELKHEGCQHPHPESPLPLLGKCSSETAGTAPADGGACCDATAGTASATEIAAIPMPDEAQMIEALKQVIDPELMINVVDLGLVYSVQSQDDNKVLVEMTLTSPACPAGPQIVQQAKISLEKLEGIKEAQIKLTLSPPWTPDRMTDEARDQLGIF